MKRVLLAGAALAALTGASFAADMPAYPVEAAVVPVDIWSGWFVGAAAGGHFSDTDLTTYTTAGVEDDEEEVWEDSWIAGIFYGRNWQSGNLVFGLEGSLNYWDHEEDLDVAIDGRPNGEITAISYETQFLGLSRLKVGYAFDSVLVYAAGGLASTNIEVTMAAGGAPETDDQWAFGFNVGAGVEAMFAENWSARIEYIYVNIEADDFDMSTGNSADVDISSSIIRGGVAYHF